MAVTVAAMLPAFLVGALAVQLRADLGIGPAGIGAATAAYSMGGMVASVSLGRLADRLGPTRALRIATGLSGLLMCTIAAGARSLAIFVVLLAMTGAAGSMGQSAANLYLARAIDARRLGLAFGIKQSAAPLGTMLAALSVPAIALTVGWRWAYAAGGLVAAAAILAVRFVPTAAVAAPPTTHQRTKVAGPAMMVLAVGTLFATASVGILSAFLVDSADELGVDNATAAWLVVIASPLGLLTRVVSGLRADQRGGRHLIVVARMLAVAAGMFVLLSVRNTTVFVLAAPFAFSAAWGWNGVLHMAVVRANQHAPGTASGVVQTGGLAGTLLGPLTGGVIASRHSYMPVWLLAAGCAATGAAIILFGRWCLVREADNSGAAGAPR